jgi:tetratricopeptide (TPR) repeat protein
LGLIHQALGQATEAEAAYAVSLDMEPRQPEAWFNLGLTCLQQHRPQEAADCFSRTLALSADHWQARRQLGLAMLSLGNGEQAVEALSACVSVEPNDPQLRFERGRAHELAGDLDRAAGDYRASAAGHGEVRARSLARLSVVLRRQGRLDDGMAAAESAAAASPQDPDVLRSLGHCQKARGELAAAGATFRRAHRILRAPEGAVSRDLPTFRMTTRAKLRHDREQFEWLLGQGIGAATLRAALEDCERILDTLPVDAADGDLVPIAGPSVPAWYNRCHHLEDAPHQPAGVLGPAVDASAIEADYRSRGPGITWIDDFLSAEALAALRRFCLNSTIWYDCDHPNGYLGAYLQDGFCCPLLLQIAEELRVALPGIFGDHRLMQLWAYKYDSRMSGIDIHADFAAVNVNFWISPTDANLDPEHGGMVIWDVEAPLEWTMDEYNTYDPVQQAAIRTFLADHNANEIVIPHRQNRCAVFNSNLLHRTDDIHFRDGYENRRINITMLFGHRESSA